SRTLLRQSSEGPQQAFVVLSRSTRMCLTTKWRSLRPGSVVGYLGQTWTTQPVPSRPREFHPEPLTDPYVNLSIHTARIIAHEGCRLPLNVRAPPGLSQLAQAQPR